MNKMIDKNNDMRVLIDPGASYENINQTNMNDISKNGGVSNPSSHRQQKTFKLKRGAVQAPNNENINLSNN